MTLSSTMCGEQASTHRERAVSAALPQVRSLSRSAAVAWEREQVLALGREQRERRRINRVAFGLAVAAAQIPTDPEEAAEDDSGEEDESPTKVQDLAKAGRDGFDPNEGPE